MFTDLCIFFVANSSLLPVVTHWWHNMAYESRPCVQVLNLFPI